MASPKEKSQATYQIRVTENAQHDIDYITGYIAFINHQPLNAIRVGDALLRLSTALLKTRLPSGSVKRFRRQEKSTAKRFV